MQLKNVPEPEKGISYPQYSDWSPTVRGGGCELDDPGAETQLDRPVLACCVNTCAFSPIRAFSSLFTVTTFSLPLRLFVSY